MAGAIAARAPRDADRKPERVLIVDDSAVVRMIVQRIVEASGRTVSGQAATAEAALAALDAEPADIILLDVEMPQLDGLAAIPELRARCPEAAIVMLSAHCGGDGELAARAIAAGAAEALHKPQARELAEDFSQRLDAAMARARPERASRRAMPAITGTELPGVSCIAIAGSTGGVHALTPFFAALPRGLAAPILITQHLPGDFIPFFARQLTQMTGRQAEVARDGMQVRPGALIVAPGHAHLGLTAIDMRVHVELNRDPQPSGCRPSADPMLAAVAAIYGPCAIAVVLSGMGRDGAIGARSLVEAGGKVFAQDETSSVVWGMPGAVAKDGHASFTGPPEALARQIERHIGLASCR